MESEAVFSDKTAWGTKVPLQMQDSESNEHVSSTPGWQKWKDCSMGDIYGCLDLVIRDDSLLLLHP